MKIEPDTEQQPPQQQQQQQQHPQGRQQQPQQQQQQQIQEDQNFNQQQPLLEAQNGRQNPIQANDQQPNLQHQQAQTRNIDSLAPIQETSLASLARSDNLTKTDPVRPALTKSNILEAIKDFDSSIPDAVVHHFLNVAGMQTSDQRIIRLIAIAAQKFVHDIVSDSLQHCKLRGSQAKKNKEKKYTLAIEDLASALSEYGIEVRRQQYFN